MGCAEFVNKNYFPGSVTVFEAAVPAAWSSTFAEACRELNDPSNGHSCTIRGGRAYTSATCAEIQAIVNPV